MEQVNLFTNGMDLDTSPELMGQGSYRYMLNGDIVKNNRGAKGVAVNEDGNLEISIIWPADNVEGASPLTPYSSNWIISKGIHDRDDLVLIYKDTAGSGQVKIDLLKFNADNSFTRIHLVDGADVGIGADNKVDAFISHETPELIRLYFYSKSSTGNTKLKHLNISPDLVGGVLQDSKLQVSYTRVNALTSVNLEIMPYVDKLLFEWYYDWNYYFTYVKGNLRVGKYVYYWRALNNGVYSEWVQITQAIPVSSTVDKPNIDQQKGEYTTNDTGNINSTIGIKLTGLGSISAEMEVARAWYSEFKGIPEVAVIYRGGGGGVSDTSYDNIIGIIDPIEFNILKPFISPKTHSVKDNTLFLGNIEEDYFDVEYDARAYRFNNLGIAEVENRRISPGVFIDSAGAWEAQVAAFDLEDDLVNPFNQDYSKGLKYKTDGTTIGGEGINVSYTITVVERKVSTEDESTNSLAVAYTENLVLQLDEIYRFGVVFYDGYMRRSPVKWIGDIRMPKHHEIIGQIGNDGFVRAMGAKVLFNIDVFNHPELQNKSFRIVSAKREGTDRTVLYEGIGTPAYRPLSLYTLPSMVANNPDYTTAFTVSGALDSFGNTYLDEVILFNSPEISFFKNAKVAGLELEFIGYFSDASNMYYQETANTGFQYTSAGHYDKSLGYSSVIKLKVLTSVTESSINYSDISHSTLLTQGQKSTIDEIGLNSGSIGGITSSVAPYYTVVEAEGGTLLAIKPNAGYMAGLRTAYSSGGSNNRVAYFRIKRNVYPYGGGSYQNRINTIYVGASGLQITTTTGVGVHYGEGSTYGDSFIGMFEFQRLVWMYESLGGANKKVAETVMFPTVSSINLQLRQDDTYTSLRWSTGVIGGAASEVREEGLYLTEYGAYEVDFSPLYLYNSVYSQIYSSQFYIERDYSKSINNVFDTKVIYSSTKLVGEEVDSYLNFKPNDFNNVESEFGAVNYMMYKNGNVYVFQDAGFALARINIRTQTPQDDGTAALLGVGSVLDGFTYISDTVGIQELNEAFDSLAYIYFLDINKKKIYRFAQSLEAVSDFKGVSAYLNSTVNENTEFLGEYDNKTANVYITLRNEVGGTLFDDLTFSVTYINGDTMYLSGDLDKTHFVNVNTYALSNGSSTSEFKFIGINGGVLEFSRIYGIQFTVGQEVRMDTYIEEKDSTTLKFNEYIDRFVSFMSFIPSIYIKGFREFYSSSDSALLFRHNAGEKGKYYNTLYPYIVSYVVNEGGAFNKQLDALNLETKMYDKIRDYSGTFDYTEIENKTFSELVVRGDRTSTEFIPIVLKNAELPTEIIGTEASDNIDPSIYIGTDRNYYEANGIRVVPYPTYLYNCRYTLNNFSLAAPRIHTEQWNTESNKEVTERVRGKTFEVKLLYNNEDDKELRLYNTTSFFSTSINQ